jgi:serine/threonine protein kinase
MRRIPKGTGRLVVCPYQRIVRLNRQSTACGARVDSPSVMGSEPGAPSIPHCRSLSPLGERPACTLYAADSHEYGGAVTVSVYPPLANELARHRFDAAVATARRLGRHPNLVTVYDSGETADGRPYIVTDGHARTTAEGMLAAHGAFDVEFVLRIGIALAGALETAHRADVIHGGIAPEVVLLTADGHPILTEVGLHRVAQEATEANASLVWWIPYHAPPESLEGTQLSPATDVYSLGSVLYTMLAGRAPRGGDPSNDTPASLLLRILQLPVPPIRRAHLPPGLEDALQTALANAPGKRQPSILELAWALQDVQRTVGLAVTEPVVLDPTSEWAETVGSSDAAASRATPAIVPDPDPRPQLEWTWPAVPPSSATDAGGYGRPGNANGNGHVLGNGATGADPAPPWWTAHPASGTGATHPASDWALHEPRPSDERPPVEIDGLGDAFAHPPQTPRAARAGPAAPSPVPRPATGRSQSATSALARAREARLERQRHGQPTSRRGQMDLAGGAIAPGPERAQPPPTLTTIRTGPPALPVAILVLIVMVLGAAATWMVVTGRDSADPPAELSGRPSPTTGAAGNQASNLTVAETEQGVRLEWDGPTGIPYEVRVLSASEPPRLVDAGPATAMIVPSGLLQPGTHHCFDIRSVPDGETTGTTTVPAPVDTAARPTACLRGASPDAMRRG